MILQKQTNDIRIMDGYNDCIKSGLLTQSYKKEETENGKRKEKKEG